MASQIISPETYSIEPSANILIRGITFRLYLKSRLANELQIRALPIAGMVVAPLEKFSTAPTIISAVREEKYSLDSSKFEAYFFPISMAFSEFVPVSDIPKSTLLIKIGLNTLLYRKDGFSKIRIVMATFVPCNNKSVKYLLSCMASGEAIANNVL